MSIKHETDLVLRLTRSIVDKCLALNSPIEKETFEATVDDIKNGKERLSSLLTRTDDKAVEPGQFGLTEVGLIWSALILPAVAVFVRQFIDRFQSKLADATAAAAADTVRRFLGSDDDRTGVESEGLKELRACFERQAKVLGLPSSTYEEFLQAAAKCDLTI